MILMKKVLLIDFFNVLFLSTLERMGEYIYLFSSMLASCGMKFMVRIIAQHSVVWLLIHNLGPSLTGSLPDLTQYPFFSYCEFNSSVRLGMEGWYVHMSGHMAQWMMGTPKEAKASNLDGAMTGCACINQRLTLVGQ